MKYNFVWSTPAAGAPIVSVASYGITFNSAVLDILQRPKRVQIGFDEKMKAIGVKPLEGNDDEGGIKSFAFAERERQGNVRIGNKDFIKYVSKKVGVNFDKACRYLANWDDEEELLVIDLDSPLDNLTSNEGELDGEPIEPR